MTYKEIQQEKAAELEKVLRAAFEAEVSEKGDLRDVLSIAQRLVKKDVCVAGTATWVRDETIQSKSKVIYRCSHCDHWRSVKKDKQDEISHIHYCNFCGRRMTL